MEPKALFFQRSQNVLRLFCPEGLTEGNTAHPDFTFCVTIVNLQNGQNLICSMQSSISIFILKCTKNKKISCHDVKISLYITSGIYKWKAKRWGGTLALGGGIKLLLHTVFGNDDIDGRCRKWKEKSAKNMEDTPRMILLWAVQWIEAPGLPPHALQI